jgi:hypothetical protein
MPESLGLRLVSGGQTGVDRAALDAARLLGIPQGGWCPRGRRAEDGVIPPEYPLQEMRQATYAARTRRNVKDSDATLILYRGRLTGGTLLTQKVAAETGKPWLVLDLTAGPHARGNAETLRQAEQRIIAWLASHKVRILNVAGPRASTDSEIGQLALTLLQEALIPWRDAALRGQDTSPAGPCLESPPSPSR